MTRIALLSTSVAMMLVVLLAAAPAQALNDKSFVSSTGGGTTCTFAAPCGNFNDAHSATRAGGEIGCLDSGFFGGAIIAKSITIDCAGTSAQSGNYIVNVAGAVLTIRNLAIFGFGNTGIGIDVQVGAAVLVENCTIRDSSIGISFAPTAPGSQLIVTDTIIQNSGSGSSGGGIVINPQSGGNATILLERVTIAKNVYGISVDGSNSTAGINLTVANSDIQGNSQNGILAFTPSGGAPIGVLVDNTRVINNNLGIRSTGSGVTVRVNNSKLTGNGSALTFNLGGALLSAGNNVVEANGVNGVFSGSLTLK